MSNKQVSGPCHLGYPSQQQADAIREGLVSALANGMSVVFRDWGASGGGFQVANTRDGRVCMHRYIVNIEGHTREMFDSVNDWRTAVSTKEQP